MTRIRTYFNTNNWINLFLAEGQKFKYRYFLFVGRLKDVQRTAGALKRPNMAFIASKVYRDVFFEAEQNSTQEGAGWPDKRQTSGSSEGEGWESSSGEGEGGGSPGRTQEAVAGQETARQSRIEERLTVKNLKKYLRDSHSAVVANQVNKNYMVEMFEQHERNISIKKINPGMSYPEYGSDASVSEQKLAEEDSEKTEVHTQTF